MTALLPDNPYYRSIPVWGTGIQTGPGPGLLGPSYGIPRPRQPGEAAALLPRYPGTDAERAQQNRELVKRGAVPRGGQRLEPYLSLDQPIIYQKNIAGWINAVDLGGPPAGYRWNIRMVGLNSLFLIDDVNFTGIRAHYYVGRFTGSGTGAMVPPATDWIWDLLSLTPTSFSLAQTWGGNPPFKVLENQHLYVYLTNGGADQYPYLAKAKIEQIPVGQVDVVENV